MSDFIAYIKTSPPARGFTGVLHPGESEYRTAEKRRREGIEVEDATWRAIQALIEEYKLDVKMTPRREP